jgi:thiamine kinase-like enzyme
MEEYIKSKSAEIICKLHNTNIFSPKDITVTQLSGISNRTYKCHLNIENSECLERLKELEKKKIKSKKDSGHYEENGLLHIDTPITTVIYKHFGKISAIVDRKLELKVIERLSSLNKGPKILETDNFTYRVEEYISNTRNISRSEIFQPEYSSQLTNIFHIFTSMTNYSKYLPKINFTNKELLLKELIEDKDESNTYNFAEKMLKLAYSSIDEFENNFNNDKSYWEIKLLEYEELKSKIISIRKKLSTSINDLTSLAPKYSLIVLSHNDAHPCNILVNDKKKLYLIDHEYCNNNYLGFDIVQFILESNFTLDHSEYPYFKVFQNFEIYTNENLYNFYRKFIEEYFELNRNMIAEFILNDSTCVDNILEHYLSKNTYYSLISYAAIYWFLYAVLYLNYDEYKFKSNFNYLDYSLVRYSVYEYLAEFITIQI